MKIKFLFALLIDLPFLFSCETKYNFIDTGISDGHFPGSMYEYLKSDSYNWDSVRLMIERGRLTELFKGNEPEYQTITFFGPKNHSVRKWMLQNGYNAVDEIDPDVCHDMILRHVVKGRYMRDDIPRGLASFEGVGQGGVTLDGGMGNKMWVYSIQEPYEDIPGVGPVVLYMYSIDMACQINIITTDIEPVNGVVHALYEDFVLGEL